MKRNLFFTLIISLIALAACGPALLKSEEPAVVDGYTTVANAYVAPSGVADAPGQQGFGGGFAGETAPAAPPLPEGQVARDESAANGLANTQAGDGRLVIKNANLSLIVDNPAATVDAVTRLAEGMGGFVVSQNVSEATYGPNGEAAQQANMTIRVPNEKLNEALAQLKSMAVEVKSQSMSGQDVTSEYTDLKSRLTNLEAAERQLQSIMEEATKTEDVMAVFQQLVYTREQIEVIKGQMKYYEQSAALSAITLSLIPNIATQPIEVAGWRPEGAAKKAIEDTIRLLQNTADALIYFSIARLPFILIFGVPALFLIRFAWKRMKKNAPQTVTSATSNQ